MSISTHSLANEAAVSTSNTTRANTPAMSTQLESGYSSDTAQQPPAKHLVLTDQTNLLPFRTIITVFMGLSLCIIVSTLDSVIVATALPTISTAFKAGSIISWVPSAYFLTSTAFQPIYGRLSDIFGRKQALCFAICTYTIGSLAAGFSRNIIELIIFRAIAGAGGGVILPMSQIVMSDIVSLRERGKYQGIIGGMMAIGYAIGPLIGGALSQKVSWRWCFWITLPIAMSAMVVVIFVLPLKPVQGDIKKKLLAIDYLGAMLTLSGCILVMLPLIWGGVTFPWSSPVVLAPLFCGLFLMVVFCIWEWKGARLPIIPMYIFKHVTIVAVYIGMFVNGFVFNSSLFYLPQFFQVGLGFSPIRSGVFLLPLPVGVTVSSFIAGVVMSHTGRYRTLVYSGFALWSIGCGCLSIVTPKTSQGLLAFLMLICGVGAGMTQQTTTIAAQACVPRKDMSVVTAVRNFVRQFGSLLSIAISSTLINNFLRKSMDGLPIPSSSVIAIIDTPAILGALDSAKLASLGISPSQAASILTDGYNRGFKWLFIMNACLTSVATLTTIFMLKHKELSRGVEPVKKETEDTSSAEKVSSSTEELSKDATVSSLHIGDSEMKKLDDN
ncbi:hypothetical protein HWV62_7505 [Athelia sp. TMB]|nr:hypothetical protein HWV62_7505 [Athelia sp. TMB]